MKIIINFSPNNCKTQDKSINWRPIYRTSEYLDVISEANQMLNIFNFSV